MKVILCALDFSEATYSIIKQALELATLMNSNLIFLFAYRLQPGNDDIVLYRQETEKQARDDFQRIMNKFKMRGKVHYEFRPEIGFLSDRVESYTKKNPVQAIVMGQNLAHSINEHRGMTFDNFLERVNVPVLVVPSRKVEA